MTDSVMSADEDKELLQAIKAGHHREDREYALLAAGGAPLAAQGGGHRSQRSRLAEKVAEIVENLDELADRACRLKLNRKDYIACLRAVTKEKVLSIKEAKRIFHERVKKLIKA